MIGVLLSVWMVRSKRWVLLGVEEPKEARMREARRGLVEVRNWWGRSLWDCRKGDVRMG